MGDLKTGPAPAETRNDPSALSRRAARRHLLPVSAPSAQDRAAGPSAEEVEPSRTRAVEARVHFEEADRTFEPIPVAFGQARDIVPEAQRVSGFDRPPKAAMAENQAAVVGSFRS